MFEACEMARIAEKQVQVLERWITTIMASDWRQTKYAESAGPAWRPIRHSTVTDSTSRALAPWPAGRPPLTKRAPCDCDGIGLGREHAEGPSGPDGRNGRCDKITAFIGGGICNADGTVVKAWRDRPTTLAKRVSKDRVGQIKETIVHLHQQRRVAQPEQRIVRRHNDCAYPSECCLTWDSFRWYGDNRKSFLLPKSKGPPQAHRLTEAMFFIGAGLR
jgi:hypothetical protein